MKRYYSAIGMGLALTALSGVLFLLHYAIFRDAHYIFVYSLYEIAFLPIEVLIVTLILHRLLEYREKRNLLKKLNMVIGSFFSEVGTELLRQLAVSDKDAAQVGHLVMIHPHSTKAQLHEISRQLHGREHRLASEKVDWVALRTFLTGKRTFLVGLLENGTLLEHEAFTDMLWAVFHLCEELECRPGFEALPPSDIRHLTGDIQRAYGRLMVQWFHYICHLKTAYPYLFSLAVRRHPFHPEASVIVTEMPDAAPAAAAETPSHEPAAVRKAKEKV